MRTPWGPRHYAPAAAVAEESGVSALPSGQAFPRGGPPHLPLSPGLQEVPEHWCSVLGLGRVVLGSGSLPCAPCQGPAGPPRHGPPFTSRPSGPGLRCRGRLHRADSGFARREMGQCAGWRGQGWPCREALPPPEDPVRLSAASTRASALLCHQGAARHPEDTVHLGSGSSMSRCSFSTRPAVLSPLCLDHSHPPTPIKVVAAAEGDWGLVPALEPCTASWGLRDSWSQHRPPCAQWGS
ncbi:hypothetical protein H1C71_012003 [Ictidomys tridecemlineatus]|nr:hypothetical protein H1C71_012003 [Ictidomys tridecemlineatus]KAG3290703.1 hypothetical protein H1C71_012003 [Ictidomys tridecemlineatus]